MSAKAPELWIGPVKYTTRILARNGSPGGMSRTNRRVRVRTDEVHEMRDGALHEVIHGVIIDTCLECHFAGDDEEERADHIESVVWVAARELTGCFERSRWEHRGRLLLPRYEAQDNRGPAGPQ